MSDKEKISIGKRTYFLSIVFVAVVVFVLSYGAFSLAGKTQSGQMNQSPTNSASNIKDAELSASPEQSPVRTNAGEVSYIGEEAAKEAALADAGMKESDVAYINCHMDYDDGRAEHYDVEFAIGNTEYEYEIDLYSGSVLGKSMDTVNNLRPNERIPEISQAADTYIGEDAAWTAALNHAGLKENEVSRKKVQLDVEDGIMVYEVEFEKGWVEYDYEINAISGEILKAEKDID